MASWTEPKTIVAGNAALASDWNTYIRDNTTHLKDRVRILTQTEYNALVRDPNTVYFIVG